jgi:zinc protease
MTNRLVAPALLLAVLPAVPFSWAPRAVAAGADIPFEKYRLANGLEVILHADTTVPTVHIELWYKVGSKDEAPGRTGLAHLFEHVMFQGTKHIPEDGFFQLLAEGGAQVRNASTTSDRTSYFETLPARQLELGLWLESSRMGFLLDRPGVRTTFDEQRLVVKNERRQRLESTPLGGVELVLQEALFPAGHPYHHHPVLGPTADLDAASEHELRSFFYRHYAPNNAILLIAGDIEVGRTKGMVEKYFGPIPAGPAINRRPVPPVKLTAERRIAMEARVSLPAGFMSWHTVPVFQPGDAEMDLVAEILAGGKSARLTRRLVHEMKIAQQVTARHDSVMHAGTFALGFTPLPGRSLAEVEKVVDEELDRLRTQPVDARELERVKNQARLRLLRSLETLQGRGARLLGYGYLGGDPGFGSQDLARYQAVDAAAIQRQAAALLRKEARVVVAVEPNPRAPIMGRVKG